MRDKCPTCDGDKDVRALQCKRCQFRDRHPRLGTGEPRRLMANGYIAIQVNRKSVYEHRYVMEQALGRKLRTDEHVHHINGDRTNNRLENLEVLEAEDHHRHHMNEAGHARRLSSLGHAARWGKHASNV